MDGPARLPEACYYTAIDATPSTGAVLRGTDPNALYAQAKCGDTILLEAGKSITQNPVWPRKGCDDHHYITLRTSTPDTYLPPEGSRIYPCYFGVMSLPGRPKFENCPASGTASLGFKIVLPTEQTTRFGDHIRIIGVEFEKAQRGLHEGLVMAGADHIILDRVWIHGVKGEEMKAGVAERDANYVAVVNSYISDIHCLARVGQCTDAVSIGGGNNRARQGLHGVFKVYGNFLEASGQSIMYGGGASVDTSCDIEIRRNLLFKPLIWNPAHASYDGGDGQGHPYIVKNHFELKNACRVYFRGNRMVNVWGGFTQVGAAVLLTPKSDMGPLGGVCPNCRVTDVTIAYNYISNAAQVLQIFNAQGCNASRCGGFAEAGYNYSIHDLIADGLDSPDTYGGPTPFKVRLSSSPKAPPSFTLHDVAINHITVVQQGVLKGGALALGGPIGPLLKGMVWKNSIFSAGPYGLSPVGGGKRNCAVSAKPRTPKNMLDACWSAPYSFTHNLIVGGDLVRSNKRPEVWPAGNITNISNQPGVGFVHLNGGVNGDYHLTAGSRGKGAADDGKDMGADIDAVMSEMNETSIQ